MAKQTIQIVRKTRTPVKQKSKKSSPSKSGRKSKQKRCPKCKRFL